MVLPKWRCTGNDLQVLRRIPLHFFCCCLYECIEMTSKPSTAISSSGAENGDRFRTPFFSGNCCFRKIFPKTSRTANSCRAFGKFNKFYNNTAPIFEQTIWRNLGAFNCLRENAVRRRRKFWPAGWPLEYGQGDKSTPLMMCIGSLSLRAGGQQPPKKRVINLHRTVTMW